MAPMNPTQAALCGSESEKESTDGYNTRIDSLIETEFPMLKGMTYLDHAGTTLCPKSLMDAFSADIMSNVLGNPHSASSSSQLATRRIEDTRLGALHFLNADPDEFDLVFVANATAGIKLVMEGFREQEQGFWYGYHKDAHTSLVGVREAAAGGHHCFESDDEVKAWLDGEHDIYQNGKRDGLGLFAFPAQSNMNGRRLPLSWIGRLRASIYGHNVYSLLDAAALASTASLDLSNVSVAPDFTVLSFNKIFGFPDLGALVVRKDSGGILQRRKYFGGGTVELVTCGKESWHIAKRGSLHEQLEDGTLPIHSIIALDNALNNYNKLYGSLSRVSSHTGYLAERLYNSLINLRHANGHEVCQIYKDPSSSYASTQSQGPIVAFNLQNSLGEWISNAEVEKLANVREIQLRSGGLCNPGGIAFALDLQPWEMKRNFSAGHRCGNENDIIGHKPTGMLRASFGAMSSMQDVTTLIDFLTEFFIAKNVPQQELGAGNSSTRNLYVESLTIYPVKSCCGWTIPPEVAWDIREEGLAWDREWCLVHQGTRIALSQKRYPKMALLRPSLDFDKGILGIRYHGPIPYSFPNEINVPLSADPGVFRRSENGGAQPCSQVCGDSIIAQTYAMKHISDFFTTVIGTPCTLARFPAASSGLSTRHSKAHLNATGTSRRSSLTRPRPILLSNESPILTISRSSLNRLNEQIKLKGGKAAHASVFRANIIVAEDPALSPGLEKPYIEDEWRSLHVGQHLKLDVLGGCRRCQMVCVDQRSAEKDQEPFVTLAMTRRREGKVFFGVHTGPAGVEAGHSTTIRVGDRIVPHSDEEQVG